MVVKVVARHAFIWMCDLIDITTIAAASGSQRTLDDRLLNQAKRSRMSYSREYKLEVVKAYHKTNLYQIFYTFASLVPSDPALSSTFASASDLYHASGCGHIRL